VGHDRLTFVPAQCADGEVVSMCRCHRGFARGASARRWCGFGAPADVFATMQPYECLKTFTTETVFRKEICGVYLAIYFAEVDTAYPDGLLYPQRMRIEVS
jgi:hypothetical protein